MTSHRTPTQRSVLIWGGGTGGVAAALQAARSGASSLLMTPGGWLGGMVSAAGVCAPDGNELTPWQTGLWGALLRALAREEPEGLDQNWVSCFGYRPSSAESILRRWVAAEPLLDWWPGCRVLEVGRRQDRITHLVVERTDPDGSDKLHRVEGRIVIDGSDRGDLFPLAAVPFRLGWEARQQWQEPSAPDLDALETQPFFREHPVQSPTWVTLGRLRGEPTQPPGCMAAPFEQATARFGLERCLSYGRLPGGLVMLNWPIHGNDWHWGLERAFADGPAGPFPSQTGAEQELATQMQDHSSAFCAALAEASGGSLEPAAVFPTQRRALLGDLAGEESLALMPYWREGRRLKGRTVLHERHLLPLGPGARIASLPLDDQGAPTSIAVGNYANDHHYPGADWPLAAKSCRWGGRWSGTPFTIPYTALVSEAVVNLLAADKCFSVSHIANGATRLQPLVLNLGQAAGMAAALCVQQNVDPGDLPVLHVQEALIEDFQAPAGPMPLWDTPWHHPHWKQRQKQALADPGALHAGGELVGAALSMEQVPAERGEQVWSGWVRPQENHTYEMEVEGRVWPVISLEPVMHDWLNNLEKPRKVSLAGRANPWGPWLRINRLIT